MAIDPSSFLYVSITWMEAHWAELPVNSGLILKVQASIPALKASARAREVTPVIPCSMFESLSCVLSSLLAKRSVGRCPSPAKGTVDTAAFGLCPLGDCTCISSSYRKCMPAALVYAFCVQTEAKNDITCSPRSTISCNQSRR